MCVGSFDHLDNCKSFGVFNVFKSMFKNTNVIVFFWYVRKLLPYVEMLVLKKKDIQSISQVRLKSSNQTYTGHDPVSYEFKLPCNQDTICFSEEDFQNVFKMIAIKICFLENNIPVMPAW